ncbi:hypothetical protein A5765_02835 [Mycolicibacterium celeriflavum]|uniref:hypothetical protein n=1 Tax=Mycolicibacterium celeriflavum TaxID=1249101 RepID=UPI0007FBF39C|nr:hypothetical protein [Mycolicibacterium celeriflavum]OBG19189.1 hypothetical protein A5765_02835 [Mycolicibacterium celeriflavum]
MQLRYSGIGAMALAAAALALFGTATATADDYVGKTYADASDAMDEEGLDPIVATRVGDKLEDDDCIVVAAWEPPFLRGVGDGFEHSEDEMLVSLNCAGPFATATKPGASVANPIGRAAKSEAEEEAAEQEEEELEAPVTPDE